MSTKKDGWTDVQLEKTGIRPKGKIQTEWGEVLIGERFMSFTSSKATVSRVYWFWRQGKSKVGRWIETPVFLPDGRLVPWDTRKGLAIKDALEMIPHLAQGAEIYRRVRQGLDAE